MPTKFSLKGLKIVIDCANGATYHIAPDVFVELGANVVPISNTPDGLNINEKCGATSTEVLAKKVVTEKADLGIALDGDGDRVMLVDSQGEVLDGDDILYIIAKHYKSLGTLQGGVVGTVMSNLGLEQALNSLDIEFIRTKVGDRYVIEELLNKKWVLGGEPSGHIISFDYNETGDGIIAALQVLHSMVLQHKTLNEIKQGLQKMPNILKNVQVKKGESLLSSEKLQQEFKKYEKKLGDSGRILIRSSGTEPVIRVMVEGKTQLEIESIATSLVELIVNQQKN